MTEIKAIKILQSNLHLDCKVKEAIEELEARKVAVKALEKQIAKKPILNNPIINNLWCEDAKLCPICHTYVDRYSLYEYCKNCGQKLLLDWGNEDAE
jgi:hypothetical protein